MIEHLPVDLFLPYPSPPMRSNDRQTWQAKARQTKSIREFTALIARNRMGPVPWRLEGPVTVELVWRVTDRRIRDAHGPDPTLKAAQDGLVDAGLIVADDTRVVVRSWCSIELGTTKAVLLRVVDARLHALPSAEGTQ